LFLGLGPASQCVFHASGCKSSKVVLEVVLESEIVVQTRELLSTLETVALIAKSVERFVIPSVDAGDSCCDGRDRFEHYFEKVKIIYFKRAKIFSYLNPSDKNHN